MKNPKIFNLQWHKTEEKLPILTFQRLEPSHGSRDDNVSLSVHHFGSWNISTNTARIAMNLCTDVHGLPRGSIPTDLTDPLTFLLLPLAGQCCHFSSEISHDIHSWMKGNNSRSLLLYKLPTQLIDYRWESEVIQYYHYILPTITIDLNANLFHNIVASNSSTLYHSIWVSRTLLVVKEVHINELW